MSLTKYLLHRSFQPNFITLLYHPAYLRRRLLYRSIRSASSLTGGRLLDYGCGRKPYQNLFAHVNEYIGADKKQTGYTIGLSAADVFFEDQLPFEDNSFDTILCFEVLEHVFTPHETLDDLYRVLKPGGKLMLTIPFFCNEHEVPYDYGRYTYYGLKYLLNKHGFDLLLNKREGSFWETWTHLFCTYTHNICHKLTGNSYRAYALGAPFVFVANLLGRLLGTIWPSDKSFYLNHFVLAEKRALHAPEQKTS